jgi:hypothetical protein
VGLIKVDTKHHLARLARELVRAEDLLPHLRRDYRRTFSGKLG